MWDLINYLKVTFSHLSQLPTVVREAIHFASCIHISKSMEQLLCGTTVRKLNMAGIANFKRNLDALLDYIGSIEIQQLKECFLALTQLLELLLSGQADKFLDPQQRCVQSVSSICEVLCCYFISLAFFFYGTTRREAGKFSHLSVESVSSVLEKVKDVKSSRLWGTSSSSQGAQKKTSLLGSVVKTLRK